MIDTTAPEGPQKQILIAEDHFVSRHLLERNLTNWGYAVTSVGDGESALAILQGPNAPPVVLLDWTMPKLDGLEVCRRVRAQKERPFTYLLLITARGHKDEIAAALEAGADEYLLKPFDVDQLRARLKLAWRIVGLERCLTFVTEQLRLATAQRTSAPPLPPTE